MNLIQNKTRSLLTSGLTAIQRNFEGGSSIPGERNKLKTFLQYFSFALILWGIKICVINYYGNAVPFGDQWDGEAANLYKPYFDGTLGWKQLLAPHNEHRVFTTRIFALILLKITHSWNPLFQMMANAGLHVIAISLAVFLLTRVVGKNRLPALLFFSFFVFGIPYSWENTLSGFQSQFYFILLLGSSALWLLLCKEPLSIAWWWGILCAMLTFLSLASGIFIFAAAAFVSFIVFSSNVRRTPKQLLSIAVLCVFFIACVKWTPSVEAHAQFKASSFHQFYNASLAVFGWPMSDSLLAAIICNLPALVFIIGVIKNRSSLNDSRVFLFGLTIWVIIQGMSIAYGRAATPLASRYRDLYAILLLANFACMLYIAANYFKKWRKWVAIAGGVWAAVVLFSLGLYGFNRIPDEIDGKRRMSVIEEENTRNYIATQDTNYIKNKPLWEIPYPDAASFARFIDMREIREILPGHIGSPLKPTSVDVSPDTAFVVNGYYFTTPVRADTTWGSYTPEIGNKSVGDMVLHFKNGDKGKRIGFPVAGYPLRGDITLEIEQNGHKWPLKMNDDPKETWQIAETSVDPGDFSLHIRDANTSYWVAVGNPYVIKRLDKLTAILKSHYYLFILFGMAILMILFINIDVKFI